MAIEDINDKIIGSVTGAISRGTIVNALGWLLLGLIVIGAIGWGFWWWMDRKKYNKKVVAEGIIHGHFYPTYRDLAKSVKLGKGGFEVLYLKKLKTWKLAHGARTGLNEYTFYILPDGYWFPGQKSADLKFIDDNKGLVQVVTTNPSMRSQYTSLEKQIDDLHAQKKGFWDKYGSWILSIAFVLIMGVFVWLSFREISGFLGSGSALADRMTALADAMNQLAVNLNQAQPNGLAR